jgi:CheY-like chemotaxis protein
MQACTKHKTIVGEIACRIRFEMLEEADTHEVVHYIRQILEHRRLAHCVLTHPASVGLPMALIELRDELAGREMEELISEMSPFMMFDQEGVGWCDLALYNLDADKYPLPDAVDEGREDGFSKVLTGRNLLLISDDSMWRSELVNVLREAGAPVVEVRDSTAAGRDMNLAACFDAVILEGSLAQGDGFGLAGEARRFNEDVPIILVLSRATAVDRAKWRACGASTHFWKMDLSKSRNARYFVENLDTWIRLKGRGRKDPGPVEIST